MTIFGIPLINHQTDVRTAFQLARIIEKLMNMVNNGLNQFLYLFSCSKNAEISKFNNRNQSTVVTTTLGKSLLAVRKLSYDYY